MPLHLYVSYLHIINLCVLLMRDQYFYAIIPVSLSLDPLLITQKQSRICFFASADCWHIVFPFSMDLSLTKNCSLTVTLRHSVKFVVIRHTKVWKRRQDHQDYLGFYTLDSHHLSASVHGLLGREQEKVPYHKAALSYFTFANFESGKLFPSRSVLPRG